jgi:hypothetical protein
MIAPFFSDQSEGGKDDPAKNLWKMRHDEAIKLGLKSRIAKIKAL